MTALGLHAAKRAMSKHSKRDFDMRYEAPMSTCQLNPTSLSLCIATTLAPQALSVSKRAMSTEVTRKIDDVKEIALKPNNSAG